MDKNVKQTTAAEAKESELVDEKDCKLDDCKKLKELPVRQRHMFLKDPVVVEKPVLQDGLTTLFEINGSTAKWADFKNVKGEAKKPPLYRLMPNKHVHVINYVVVDDEAMLNDMMRKINNKDPETLQHLSKSQKVVAQKMLEKVMAGHGESKSAVGETLTGIYSGSGEPEDGQTVATVMLTSTPSFESSNASGNDLPINQLNINAAAENWSATSASGAAEMSAVVANDDQGEKSFAKIEQELADLRRKIDSLTEHQAKEVIDNFGSAAEGPRQS